MYKMNELYRFTWIEEVTPTYLKSFDGIISKIVDEGSSGIYPSLAFSPDMYLLTEELQKIWVTETGIASET